MVRDLGGLRPYTTHIARDEGGMGALGTGYRGGDCYRGARVEAVVPDEGEGGLAGIKFPATRRHFTTQNRISMPKKGTTGGTKTTQADAARIQSSQAKGGQSTGKGSFPSRAQSAAAKNANASAAKATPTAPASPKK
ncbi:hypothetical protein EVG20_g7332 [Dentipellis fragilis]|uniref:Uncharacterized protein n=1 Tax=Dentipellis fragilis TaxID=205917 RepID=A0A4Y9YFC1_9AGAM|nr:hypothetical protein EVG20_g7332 [Dentipellis fragilis]